MEYTLKDNLIYLDIIIIKVKIPYDMTNYIPFIFYKFNLSMSSLSEPLFPK